jgi:hypothetical protein
MCVSYSFSDVVNGDSIRSIIARLEAEEARDPETKAAGDLATNPTVQSLNAAVSLPLFLRSHGDQPYIYAAWWVGPQLSVFSFRHIAYISVGFSRFNIKRSSE